MLLEPVRHGDIVDVVAPASRCTDQELKAALRALRDLGLVPRVPRGLFAKSLLFSNSDEVRLRQLKAAVYARDSKLIWCVRGGYGALRLMPSIAKWKRPARAKIFIGYSDITTLHTHFNQAWKWPTLHGPLLDRLGRGAMSVKEKKELFGMIFGSVPGAEFTRLRPLNAAAKSSRRIRGVIRGGNLAVLQSGLGTPTGLRGGKHILFLEDIGERPHRVDRMLTQLAQSGCFDGVQAVVFGHFNLTESKDRRGLWNDVVPRFAASMRIPVLAGLPVGHDPKLQFTLPFNTPSELTLGRSPALRVSSGIRGLGG